MTVEQLLGLMLAWAFGVLVCAAIARRITVRYRLPWRAALMYFGLLDYPDEATLVQRRRRPSRTRRRAQQHG